MPDDGRPTYGLDAERYAMVDDDLRACATNCGTKPLWRPVAGSLGTKRLCTFRGTLRYNAEFMSANMSDDPDALERQYPARMLYR